MTSVAESAASGDRLAALEALRDKLAQSIDSTDNGHDVSALSNQLTSVLKQIDEIKKSQRKRKATPLDLARTAVNGR